MTDRESVLSLRRVHSARKVAELTGLPLGTVKAICSRSGAFRDNQKHRALFSLPEPRPSDCTGLVVPGLPPQEPVTEKCVKPRPSGRGRKARSPLGLLNPPPVNQRP